MEHFTFEYCVAVEPLVLDCTERGVPKAGAIAAGFAQAETIEQCLAELREELAGEGGLTDKEQLRLLTITAEWLEFDSSNWTHATSYFRVSIAARDEGVEAVKKTFAHLLED